jgi:hypothetical protein
VLVAQCFRLQLILRASLVLEYNLDMASVMSRSSMGYPAMMRCAITIPHRAAILSERDTVGRSLKSRTFDQSADLWHG